MTKLEQAPNTPHNDAGHALNCCLRLPERNRVCRDDCNQTDTAWSPVWLVCHCKRWNNSLHHVHVYERLGPKLPGKLRSTPRCGRVEIAGFGRMKTSKSVQCERFSERRFSVIAVAILGTTLSSTAIRILCRFLVETRIL